MPPEKDSLVEIASRADLRAWLSEHHALPHSVWLVTWKKPDPRFVPYESVVEELLCWGWIDSVPRKVDAERSALRISRRKPGSAWSVVNKAHVARARASGAMTPPGEAAIAAAQSSGLWEFLDDVDRLEVPPDLAAVLEAAGLTPVWEGWPRSVRRGTLEWIKTARTAPTRAARIGDVSQSAAAGLRPSPFRR
jgi:uncharacterized protein YdeI (YjbR/CyaY-like superfamily)